MCFSHNPRGGKWGSNKHYWRRLKKWGGLRGGKREIPMKTASWGVWCVRVLLIARWLPPSNVWIRGGFTLCLWRKIKIIIIDFRVRFVRLPRPRLETRRIPASHCLKMASARGEENRCELLAIFETRDGKKFLARDVIRSCQWKLSGLFKIL